MLELTKLEVLKIAGGTEMSISVATYGSSHYNCFCDATVFVAKVCNETTSCIIWVDNSVCGFDPCANEPAQKELDVYYKCAETGYSGRQLEYNDLKLSC